MIDVENIVFDTVVKALRDKFPKMNPSGGETQPTPSDLPTAIGREMDNSTYMRSLDSSGQENHATVMWQWEALSNKLPVRKSECKAIMAIIDTQMFAMGFTRVGNSPMEMPNASASIYRMVARYKAVISKEKMVYRR